MTHTEDEALKLARAALKRIADGESDDPCFYAGESLEAIEQALALDKKAENARELGLDYEPADGTQVSKVWWDGEKLMAKPIPLEDFYQLAHGCTRSHPHENMDAMCELRTEIARLTNENARLKAQPAPVQEPVAWLYPEGLEALQNGKCWTAYPTKHDGCNIPLCTPPAAQPAPVQPLAYLYHDAPRPELANPMLHSTLLVFAGDRRPELRGETPLCQCAPPAAQRQCEDEK